MDYGQAKTILSRIFKEYKVFYDLDEVIEFANMQEQRKEVLEKEIAELVAKKDSEAGALERLGFRVADSEKRLKDLDIEYGTKQEHLESKQKERVEIVEATLKVKKDEFFKEAARLEEAMEDAAGRLEKLNVEADAAEKRLAKAKAAYDKFKESI